MNGHMPRCFPEWASVIKILASFDKCGEMGVSINFSRFIPESLKNI